MGKTFKASVDWLGMVENGGVLPGQDVDPSVNGGKAQTGEEISEEIMLPEVTVSALTDKSYNKLSDAQKQVYDSFIGPDGGVSQTVDIGNDYRMHWSDALKMVDDVGVRNIYNRPNVFMDYGNRGAVNFRPHANPVSKDIYIPKLAEEGDSHYIQGSKDLMDKIRLGEVAWVKRMSEQERANFLKRMEHARDSVNRMSYFSDLIAELAHIPEFWRSETFINIPITIKRRIERGIKEGRIPDYSNYSDPKDIEYHTHTGPNSFEQKLREKYGYKEISNLQYGGEEEERKRFIKFIKDNEGGYDYIRAKDSAIKKLDADGNWDGKSYYKIFDEETQKYYPYFLDDEKGATIGHGHHNKDVYEMYKDGISIEKAEELLNLDVDNKMSDTEIWWTKKYGEGEWDKLNPSTKYMLGDIAYNTGHIRNYKIFADAIKRGDWKTAEANYSRGTSKGGPRLGRNKTFMEEYLKPWMDMEKEKVAVAPPLDEMVLPIGTYLEDMSAPEEKETSWWRGEEGIVPDELQWWKNGGPLPKAQDGWWSDFEKSKVGKFVDAKGLRRDGEYMMNTIGDYFGYENTAEDARKMGLDASAIVNPVPDFINAADHYNQGKYTDAALYAGFGILPFSAGPLVRGTKDTFNYLKNINPFGKNSKLAKELSETLDTTPLSNNTVGNVDEKIIQFEKANAETLHKISNKDIQGILDNEAFINQAKILNSPGKLPLTRVLDSKGLTIKDNKLFSKTGDQFFNPNFTNSRNTTHWSYGHIGDPGHGGGAWSNKSTAIISDFENLKGSGHTMDLDPTDTYFYSKGDFEIPSNSLILTRDKKLYNKIKKETNITNIKLFENTPNDEFQAIVNSFGTKGPGKYNYQGNLFNEYIHKNWEQGIDVAQYKPARYLDFNKSKNIIDNFGGGSSKMHHFDPTSNVESISGLGYSKKHGLFSEINKWPDSRDYGKGVGTLDAMLEFPKPMQIFEMDKLLRLYKNKPEARKIQKQLAEMNGFKSYKEFKESVDMTNFKKYGGQYNWGLDLRSSTREMSLGGPADVGMDEVYPGHMATDYQEDYQAGYQDHYTGEYGSSVRTIDKTDTSAQYGNEVKSDDIYSNDKYSTNASKYKRMLPKYQSEGEAVALTKRLPEVNIDGRGRWKKAYQDYISPIGHGILDVAGLVPGLGEPFDALNAAWYTGEGNYTDAALSAAAIIPFAGWAATGSKWAKNTYKALEKATPGGGDMYLQLKKINEMGKADMAVKHGYQFNRAKKLGVPQSDRKLKKLIKKNPEEAQKLIDKWNVEYGSWSPNRKLVDGKVQVLPGGSTEAVSSHANFLDNVKLRVSDDAQDGLNYFGPRGGLPGVKADNIQSYISKLGDDGTTTLYRYGESPLNKVGLGNNFSKYEKSGWFSADPFDPFRYDDFRRLGDKGNVFKIDVENRLLNDIYRGGPQQGSHYRAGTQFKEFDVPEWLINRSNKTNLGSLSDYKKHLKTLKKYGGQK